MLLILILKLLFIVGCNSGGNSDFSILDDGSGSNEPATEAARILTYSPSSSPVVVTDSTSTTFGVTINPTAGSNVTFEFLLDGVRLQYGSSQFYSLSGSVVSGGSHTLRVVATNSIGSDTHSFTVNKNSAPIVTASTPAPAGNNVTCGSGTITFEVTGSDSDGDSLTFSWNVDGIALPAMFSVTTVGSSSEAVFAPTCALNGLMSVNVVISDGHDTVTESWLVTVSNPTVASVDSYTPLDATVVISSSGSQLFSISASGKAPLTYSWILNGAIIPGATSAFYTLAAGSVTAGNHTLVVRVEDSDSFDEHTFAIKKNAPPAITAYSPTSSPESKNVGTLFTYAVDASDVNGDVLTYTWTIDGSVYPGFTGTPTAGGSQAIGTATDGDLGDHTIMVEVSDGLESITRSWIVNINKFSDWCNALDAGEICTIVGSAGLGNNQNPSVAHSYPITVAPSAIANDGSGNLFITGQDMSVVWFYNRSGVSVTRLGQTIPANTAKILVGVGMNSFKAIDGNTGTNIPLYTPAGIAYDAARDYLFISNYNRHRVVAVNSSGVEKFLCNGGTGNNTANHPIGGNVTAHACYYPTGLAYDSGTQKLYVANYSGNNVKIFDVSNADPANWTGRLLVGRQDGAGAVSAGSDNGPINSGPGGVTDARVNGPWALDLDSSGNLYISTYGGCKARMVNLSGALASFFDGGVTIADDNVGTLFGTTCGQDAIAAPELYTAINFGQNRGFQVWEDGGIKGFFINNTQYHRSIFVNNTTSAISVGGRAVPGLSSWNIFGTGNAEYNGNNSSGYLSYLYGPYGLELIGDELLVADYGNGRVRTLDLSVADGDVGSIIGDYQKNYFMGEDPTLGATETRLNLPRFLAYDDINNGMLYTDYNNGRVRQLSLETGLVSTVIGNGWGNDDGNDDDPTAMQLAYLTGVFFDGGNILFSEGITNTGADRNCSIKYYNSSASSVLQSDITVPAEKVSTIGGNFSLGCADWNEATFSGDDAISTTLRRPTGVVKSVTDIIFANYYNNCLMKIASDGTVSTFLGLCGTAGDADGVIGGAGVRLRNPLGISIDPQYEAEGNMFVADSYMVPGKIKYINRSASTITIFGTACPANSVTTITSTGGYSIGVAAFDNQICYTSGYEDYGYYGGNVICKNRQDPIGAVTMRAGAADATNDGRGAIGIEQEGIPAYNARLASPYGLAFDSLGNLYISEYRGHSIRKVKRWW